MIYQLNYGIEYLGLGKVTWYQQKISTQIARVPRTYVVENKEVPDSNIGVPPVCKYANYRTLSKYTCITSGAIQKGVPITVFLLAIVS
jgi:hypothetical protein